MNILSEIIEPSFPTGQNQYFVNYSTGSGVAAKPVLSSQRRTVLSSQRRTDKLVRAAFFGLSLYW